MSGITSDNEWQIVTTNDNEWYNEWQRVAQPVTKNDTEWQRLATNDNEWQRGAYHYAPKGELFKLLRENLWKRPIELREETSTQE